VYISTAVPPEFMGIRAKRIKEEFPQIPTDHIYMGASKDKISTDILFDDAMHNVLHSNAQYPILMRRPWNQEATGMLAVNTYEEFLKVVEVIAASYAKDGKPDLTKPSIIVLVGASGCGKSTIAKKLLQKVDIFEKPISYTTEDPTALEENDWYSYVPLDEFREMCETGELFQSTMYAGHGYGSCKSDLEEILNKGKHVLTTMDICGAMSLKTHFDNVTTIYISREKKALLSAILRKNCSNEDKINRIMSIEYEKPNAALCDYVVKFDNYDDAVNQLLEILEL
jgi:guanylate kinase